jgi:competence protein ComEC
MPAKCRLFYFLFFVLNNYPLIKLSALLISGISFASYFNVKADIFLILFIICFTISFLIEFVFNPEFKQKKILNEVFLNITLFLSGIILFVFKTDVNQDNYFGKIIETNDKSSYISDVQIISPITEKGNYLNFEVEVNRLTFKDYYSLVIGKSLVYVLKDSSSLKLLPGDNIRLNTVFSKVTFPKNPGQFNYSDYLKTEEIEYLCYANNEWSFQSSKSNLNRFAAISRNYCIKAFEKSGLNNEEYALATALSFGYRDKLDQNIKQSFSNTGAMHILAVSGLHVGILYVIIVYLLKSLNISVKYNWLKSLIIIFIIWFFAFITGLSSSVLRAVTMLSFL